MGFRRDFIWGAATAAYQIEGAAFEGGKGLSVWDQFSHVPGHVRGMETGDTACDHYHRFEQDMELMRELGIRHYRFSISWPRLLPEGRGPVSSRGRDFYNRLIDAMVERGIRPFATLFHWDYPAALQARGGWENPDSPMWFEDYAALCARLFGDRVKDFFTLNEPQCFIGMGCETGEHAPGLRLDAQHTIPMAHHVLKAHALAVRALRAHAPGCRVGYAPTGTPCIPASQSDADVAAAQKAYFDVPADEKRWTWNVAWWSDPVLLGTYPEEALRVFERHLPEKWERDLETMCQPLDYYGQNIYHGRIIRAAQNAQGYEEVPFSTGFPRTAMQWPVTPDALYWGPKFLYERYKTPILITENGMACHDAVSLDGKVHDPNREDYMRRYLLAYRRAAEEGVDAAGYFAWSLMDNFEWACGYGERFGLIYVDFATQARVIKDSELWYRRVMAHNGEEAL